MPDLITHTAAAYAFGRPFMKVPTRLLFYVGAILPDLLPRPLYIISPKLYSYSIAMHTPIFLVILTLLVSEFFAPAIQKSVRTYILLGVVLHLILDSLQKHLTSGGYYWFFPFSWASFEFGLLWPDQFVVIAPYLGATVLIIELVIWVIKKKRRSFEQKR